MKVLTVTELNAQIHDLLESSFSELWVEGEISNCKSYPSGHTYLTLKDEQSQIRAVLWKGNAQHVKFRPEDGLKIVARGRVTSYPVRGDLQFVISTMEPREKGALQLAFEQLKAKLQAEGLFDEERKKELPAFPLKIGIVTSPKGAALHDMLSVLKRRWDGLEILVAPVAVQGEAAKNEIAQGIADLNRHFPDLDVLLIGRGGGSIEDLWAFNEEVVARAIANSAIPTISCVGHETDFTIADFVADRRAPTPSAAAEMAVPDKRAALESVYGLETELVDAILDRIEGLERRVEQLAAHPFLQSPTRLYEDRLRRVAELATRLPEAARQIIRHAEKDLALQMQKLDAFSPLKVLSRGYAIAEKLPGREIVRKASQVKRGDTLRLLLGEGRIHCEVVDER
jgi:exodeoxyribonuclease VII large subunit